MSNDDATMPNQQPDEVTGPCPICGEEVRKGALKCKHCEEWIRPRPSWWRVSWTEFRYGKTLWDVVSLLIVPLALLLIGTAFSFFDTQRQLAVESRRLAAQATVEADRSEEAVLQAYLDSMTDLLEKGLRQSEQGDTDRSIARARTLTVLRQLDEVRKGLLLLFLHESDLLGAGSGIDIEQEPVVSLNRADLSGAELVAVNLSGVNLRWTHLIRANLALADLSEANLRSAYMFEANLRQANLGRAYLFGAELGRANLSGADLTSAYLSRVSLVEADLGQANLSGANLALAKLTGADLEAADLTGANLNGADLTGANLRNAVVTDEQLAATSSLKGAMMPDGTVHE